jgi:hypothetical protein
MRMLTDSLGEYLMRFREPEIHLQSLFGVEPSLGKIGSQILQTPAITAGQSRMRPGKAWKEPFLLDRTSLVAELIQAGRFA